MAQTEAGDDYVRRFAGFLRTHQSRLADAGFLPRRAAPSSAPVFSWLSLSSASASSAHPPAPTVLSLDTHHLLYLLARFESLGLPIGSLDTRLETPLPSNSAYLSLLRHNQPSDTISIFSFQSAVSAVSSLSLPPGLTAWIPGAAPAPPPSIESELRHIYTALTLLPALSIHQPTARTRLIAELASDPMPTDTALPLDVFRSLAHLELDGVDPRDFLGWDRVCVGLRSLTLRHTAVEDVNDVLVQAVANDLRRRAGELRTPLRNRPRLIHKPSASLRSVPEEAPFEPPEDPAPELPAYAWSTLTTLSLPSNFLTFLLPPPTSALLSLDLSHNLLVSLPPALSSLPAIQSLNISHNLLDSILNVPLLLPRVRTLLLSHNRLDSLCGLERLPYLERVDVRSNRIDDPAEIGIRLAQCPKLHDVLVCSPASTASAPSSPGAAEGDEPNPFCTRDPSHWRVHLFELFAKEGRPDVLVDGSGPGWQERMAMSTPHTHPASAKPILQSPQPPSFVVTSPPPVIVSTTPPTNPSRAPPTSTPSPRQGTPASAASVHAPPSPSPKSGPKRRKPARRIVDLDGSGSSPDLGPTSTPSKAAGGRGRPAPTETVHIRAPDPSAAAAPSTSPPNGTPDADAFRARIEALREEVGESWLKVLSQGRELAGVQGAIVGAPAAAGEGKVGT